MAAEDRPLIVFVAEGLVLGDHYDRVLVVVVDQPEDRLIVEGLWEGGPVVVDYHSEACQDVEVVPDHTEVFDYQMKVAPNHRVALVAYQEQLADHPSATEHLEVVHLVVVAAVVVDHLNSSYHEDLVDWLELVEYAVVARFD